MATYKEAGVDLDAADAVVDRIKGRVTATWGADVVGGFGGFAAGIKIPSGYRSPVLMMSTDGVGTKAEVARRTGILGGLGSDLVAMCVDDLVAVGARPIALTDYIAVGKVHPAMVETLVGSIADACALAGVALLGGETAEHPGVMDEGAFDLAAAALGVVEEGREITGGAVVPGDVVVGVASPNLRSNGFSLVRHVVAGSLDEVIAPLERSLASEVLEPSVIYAPAILDVIDHTTVHGLAHITGGGLPGNLVRVLPQGLEAIVDTGTWDPPPIFEVIARLGHIERQDMFSTFNMGIGFAIVCPEAEASQVSATLAESGHQSFVIGNVAPGTRGVVLV